jgi:hypothetical protein
VTLLDIAISINGAVAIVTLPAPLDHAGESVMPESGDAIVLAVRAHKTSKPWKTTPATQLK